MIAAVGPDVTTRYGNVFFFRCIWFMIAWNSRLKHNALLNIKCGHPSAKHWGVSYDGEWGLCKWCLEYKDMGSG